MTLVIERCLPAEVINTMGRLLFSPVSGRVQSQSTLETIDYLMEKTPLAKLIAVTCNCRFDSSFGIREIKPRTLPVAETDEQFPVALVNNAQNT